MEWGVKCYLHDSPVLHNNTNKRASAQRAPRKQLGQLCQTHAIISVSFGSYFENSNSGLGHEWFFLYCEMEGHLSTKCTTCAWFIIKHVSVCRYLQRSTELTFCLQTLSSCREEKVPPSSRRSRLFSKLLVAFMLCLSPNVLLRWSISHSHLTGCTHDLLHHALLQGALTYPGNKQASAQCHNLMRPQRVKNEATTLTEGNRIREKPAAHREWVVVDQEQTSRHGHIGPQRERGQALQVADKDQQDDGRQEAEHV